MIGTAPAGYYDDEENGATTPTQGGEENTQAEAVSDDGENIQEARKHPDPHQMAAELHNAGNIVKSVEKYADIMDKYGIEAILSLIPILGDAGMATISFLFFMWQANKLGLSRWDKTKLA